MEKKNYILENNFSPQSRFDNLNRIEPEFWKKKKLDDMSPEEWELLCDGCGKCCSPNGPIPSMRPACRSKTGKLFPKQE